MRILEATGPPGWTRAPAWMRALARARMVRVGGTQALLLGPSLALTIAVFVCLSIPSYATWGLLFSLGSGAIVLDCGAFQLAQVFRAEGPLTRAEAAKLLGLASISPAILTLLMTIGFSQLNSLLLDGRGRGGATLALLIGLGTLLSAWQNVLNGVMIAQREDSRRFWAAVAAAVPMLVGIVLIPVLKSLSVPAVAYLVSSAVGIAAIASRTLRFADTPSPAAVAPPTRTPAALPTHPSADPPIRPSAEPPTRAPAEVRTRTFVAALSVLLTQGDRVMVGLLGSISGLAAYDLASRFVTSVKLIVILLSTGMVAEGSRAAAGLMTRAAAEVRRHRLQHIVDATTLGIFVLCPLLVTGVALIAQPSLAGKTALIATILAVGHGVHASTAPTTAFLSGMRFPRAEVRYQLIAVAVLIVTAPILGLTLGATGIALSVALALGSGSLWLRAHAPTWISTRLQTASEHPPSDLPDSTPPPIADLRSVEL